MTTKTIAARTAKTSAASAPEPMPSCPRSDSKISHVIALLHRDEGATLEELVAATGWQPHTARAALTGLKKKRHTIVKSRRNDVTCYRITGEV